MKTIYKYELLPNQGSIRLPKGAKVLSAGCQGDSVFLWAEVEPDTGHETRIFAIYGTGHEITETNGYSRIFIDTVQMRGGALIFHVFEQIRQP